MSGSTLKYSFYELGSSAHGGYQYPAVELTPSVTLGTALSAGEAFSFGKSVSEGVGELQAYVKEVSAACPQTKFVLGGYSQGAMVLTKALPGIDPDKLIYSAAFGDPKLYLPEGFGLNPDACKGKNLSDYRTFAPNCHTYAGVLTPQKPYRDTGFAGKVGIWCSDKDFMCGAGVAFDHFLDAHLNYVKDGHFTSAAKIIAEKIKASFKTQTAGLSTSRTANRDTVILLDNTVSMAPMIANYKAEARRLANETIRNGGRIALYTYGDLADSTPAKLVDFGDNFVNFSLALDSITTFGGSDPDESALSALLTVMNTLNWRPNATKSIILMTDAGYHNPDIDGTTFEQVVARSLEIDPVNVYVINTYSSAVEYETLVAATNGRLFTTTEDFGTDYLLNRPVVNFPLSEYSAQPGEEITFSLETDGDIVEYLWDLDFDGIFETSGGETMSEIYVSPGSGYVQAKVKDANGLESTASASVKIEDLEELPEISSLSAELNGNTAIITFETSAPSVLVALNDAIVGMTTERTLEISEVSHALAISLTPISQTGELGTQKTISVTPSGYGAALAKVDTRAQEPAQNTSESAQPDLPLPILAPKAGYL